MQTKPPINELLRAAEHDLKYLKKIEHANYGKLFTEEIEEYKISSKKEIKIIDTLLKNFKDKKSTDEKANFLDLIEVRSLIKKTHLDSEVLDEKIYNEQKKDFLNGKFSGYLFKKADKYTKMENVIRSAVKNANLPASHIKDVEAIKELRKEINSEREKGNLPLEAIPNLKTLLEDSHKKIIDSVALMNMQGESAQKLVSSLGEFGRYASRPESEIEGSSNSDDKSRQTPEEALFTKISDLPKGFKGLFGPIPSKSLPLKEAPGLSNSAIGAGAFTLLALAAATWYWMRQNAKTKEKPVEEKFNPEDLKIISPLFGNENIKIENQKVHFNDFQEELVENIKRFFKDYKNIKTTENDKGLTLNLKNLSAREGKEVFSKFLKEFTDDLNKHAELSQQKRNEEELQKTIDRNEKQKINDLIELKNIILESFKKIETIENTRGGNESKKNNDIDLQTKRIRANLKILDDKELNPQYIKILLENSQKLSTSTNDPIDVTAHQARETKYTAGANPSDPSTNPASLNATRAGGGGAVGRN